MAITAEEQAELSFKSHDWDSDAAWTAKLSQVYFSKSADERLAMMRLKRKYFSAEINPNLSLEPLKPDSTAPKDSSASSSEKSTDFPRKLCISANYATLFLHVFNLFAAIGYFLSFSSVQMGSSCFRALMISSLISSIVQIIVKHGKPQLKLSYAQLVLSDDQSHFVMMYFAMLFSHPLFLAIVPVCLRSILFLSLSLNMAVLPMFLPEYHRKLGPYLSVLEEKRHLVTDWLSQLDVALGFILLFSLLTASRQPMVTLLFWQYLRIRYMFSSSGRSALQTARRKLDSYLLHPRSPSFVQKIYQKVQDFAFSTVDPDQARSRQDQLQNAKCQIM